MAKDMDFEKEIRKHELAIESLREKQNPEKMPEDKKLAVKLHSMLCRHNHVDGCSWDYEEDPNYSKGTWGHGTTHAHYLNKAVHIMKDFRDIPLDRILAIIAYVK